MAGMSDDAEPVLRVVRGNPTQAELAVLVTVLWARAGGDAGNAGGAVPPRPSSWAAYWNQRRAPLSPGVDAGRASALRR